MPSNNTSKKFIPAILILPVILIICAGCGQKTDSDKSKETPAASVKTQTVGQSTTFQEKIEYPAIISAGQEAKIIAKTAGNASDVKFKVGDQVKMGDILAKIDDPDKTNASGQYNFNTSQVKQAKVAVEQALTNLQLSQTNYNNLLISSANDLRQIEIAKNQAQVGEKNIGNTTSENFKSAQLAYETAKIASEQAKLNLENRKKSANQSSQDIQTNSQTTADTIANACGSLISSINNIIAFDTTGGISVTYATNLGALDINSYNNAKSAYLETVRINNQYQAKNFYSSLDKVKAVIVLAQQIKKMVDSTKYLLEKSITSNVLPLTSLTGTSLSGLQTTVSGYQGSINSNISQLNSVKQALENTDLNNDTTLSSLEKAYELAKNQEAAAKQNMENLKAGNTSQKDNANFSVEAAKNQYETAKSKIDTQIAVSKSQVDLAQLQYSNAAIALQNLYDIHVAISPIDGTITKKSVENGDTISAGQILAIVSQMKNIKLSFFVDQTVLTSIKPGQSVEIVDNDGKAYPGKISSVSLQADANTKRFSVEAIPDVADSNFSLGTVMTVRVPITKIAENKDAIILPLSSIAISANENYIYILDENNKAKKISIKIKKVEGESAEIIADLASSTKIVIDGNKLIQEGDLLTDK